MRILRNKFFLLGNLLFLIISIPVVLFLLSDKTTTDSSAVASSTLSFNPSSINTTECSSSTQATLVLNPGQNDVSSVVLYLKWDKSRYSMSFTPNSDAFPQILSGPTVTADGYIITLNIGGDVSKVITSATNVGTVTLTPTTSGGASPLTIDAQESAIYSLANTDGATENVYNPSGSSPLNVNITSCGSQTSNNTTNETSTNSNQSNNNSSSANQTSNSSSQTTSNSSTQTTSNTSTTSNSSSSTINTSPTSSATKSASKNLIAANKKIEEPGFITPTIIVLLGVILIVSVGIFLLFR